MKLIFASLLLVSSSSLLISQSAADILAKSKNAYQQMAAYQDEGQFTQTYAILGNPVFLNGHFKTNFVKDASIFQFELNHLNESEAQTYLFAQKTINRADAFFSISSKNSPIFEDSINFEWVLKENLVFHLSLAEIFPSIFLDSDTLFVDAEAYVSLESLAEEKIDGQMHYQLKAHYQLPTLQSELVPSIEIPIQRIYWIRQKDFLITKIEETIESEGLRVSTTLYLYPSKN